MRLEKSVKIDNKTYTIREFTARDFINIYPKIEELLKNNASIMDVLVKSGDIANEIIAKVTDLKIDNLLDLSFSELDMLENAFWEVNSAFLKRSGQMQSLVEKLGIKELTQKVWSVMLRNWEEFLDKSLPKIQSNQNPS